MGPHGVGALGLFYIMLTVFILYSDEFNSTLNPAIRNDSEHVMKCRFTEDNEEPKSSSFPSLRSVTNRDAGFARRGVREQAHFDSMNDNISHNLVGPGVGDVARICRRSLHLVAADHVVGGERVAIADGKLT